jgi:hypothetical protein
LRLSGRFAVIATIRRTPTRIREFAAGTVHVSGLSRNKEQE